MKKYNMDEYESGTKKIAEIQGWKPAYNGDVLKETKKVHITTDFKTRDFQFTNGPGEVADKLIITIDFKDVNLQPDQDFEDHFASACADQIAGHIEGLWDNAE